MRRVIVIRPGLVLQRNIDPDCEMAGAGYAASYLGPLRMAAGSAAGSLPAACSAACMATM